MDPADVAAAALRSGKQQHRERLHQLRQTVPGSEGRRKCEARDPVDGAGREPDRRFDRVDRRHGIVHEQGQRTGAHAEHSGSGQDQFHRNRHDRRRRTGSGRHRDGKRIHHDSDDIYFDDAVAFRRDGTSSGKEGRMPARSDEWNVAASCGWRGSPGRRICGRPGSALYRHGERCV